MLDWFAGAVASANAAKEISQSLMTLRDEEMIRSRVFDLTQSLMELQQQLMQAQLERMELIKRVEELETQRSQEKEKAGLMDQYRLHRFPRGTLAYQYIGSEGSPSEPAHYACANCFNSGNIAILQSTRGGYICHRCGKVISTG